MSYSSVELVRRYKISPTQIIHVGAWEGLDVPEYKTLEISKITLVEAMPDKARALRERFSDDHQVEIIEAAASNVSNATVSFYPLEYGSSSLLKPKIESLQHVFADFAEIDPITVRTIRIDEIETSETEKIMLIIDVQGAELQVLKGSIKTLKKTVLIKVELSTVAYYEGQSHQKEITHFLEDHGFVCLSKRISKKMGQGDAIFLQRGQTPAISIFVGQLWDLRWKLSIQRINLHTLGKTLRTLRKIHISVRQK